MDLEVLMSTSDNVVGICRINPEGDGKVSEQSADISIDLLRRALDVAEYFGDVVTVSLITHRKTAHTDYSTLILLKLAPYTDKDKPLYMAVAPMVRAPPQ